MVAMFHICEELFYPYNIYNMDTDKQTNKINQNKNVYIFTHLLISVIYSYKKKSFPFNINE